MPAAPEAIDGDPEGRLLDQPAPLSTPERGLSALEPNDRDRPLELPEGRFPTRVTGFFDAADDVDAVRVTGLRVDRPTTVELAPLRGHRPILRVLTASGELLASVSAQRTGEGTGIPNLAPRSAGQPLLLEISDGDAETSTRPWTLMLHRADLGPIGELEPNDREQDARALVATGGVFDVVGLFHRADDVDFYTLQLAQAGALTLTLAPDDRTDAVLTWHEPDGVAMPLDLAGVGEVERLCAQLVEPGSHLVEVAARGLDASFARYQLTGRVETGAFEHEPNDVPGARGVVDVAGSIRGYLASPGDVDVYGLSLIAPVDTQSSQRVTVVPPVGVDVAVEVVDEAGAPVVRPTDDAGRGQREAVRVPLGLFRYYLIVRAGARGGVGCQAPYEIRLD